MNNTHTDIDHLLDRAIADGRRRRVMEQQRENALTRLARLHRAKHIAFTLVLMAGSSGMVSSCISVPDGRDMNTDTTRTQALSEANLVIQAL